MNELSFEFFLLPAVSIMIFLEFVIRFFVKKQQVDFADNLSSLAVGLIYFGGLLLSNGLILAASMFVYEYRLFNLPLELTWWSLPLLLLTREFGSYWFHRWAHEVRLLWCIHKTHHSATDLSFATSVRMPFFEIFAWAPATLLIPLMGFHPIVLPSLKVAMLIYGMLIHTQVITKLGRWEKWSPFTTPSHHRVHHGANIKYLDKNYGGFLTLFDRLFGTFQIEEEEVVIGLRENVTTKNPVSLNFFGFKELLVDIRKSPDLFTALKYIFYPPGWSHDGADLRARTLQRELVQIHN